MPATRILPGDLNLNSDIDITASTAATTLQINNTATSGDSQLAFALSGTKKFTIGIDDSDSDKFKIGTTAVGTSTRLTINSSGDIGIGTASPNETLEVASDGRVFIGDGAGDSRVGLLIDGKNGTNPNEYIRILGYDYGTSTGLPIILQDTGGGYVGIGTDTTPSYPLSVGVSKSGSYVSQLYNSYNGSAGGLFVKAGDTSSTGSPLPFVVQSYNGTNQFYVRQDGKYYHRGSLVSTEDSKRNILTMSENATNILKDIRVVTYNYIEDTDDRTARIGFIADDIDNQPEIDTRLTDGGTGFDVQTIVGTLIKSVQELNQRIETLENRS